MTDENYINLNQDNNRLPIFYVIEIDGRKILSMFPHYSEDANIIKRISPDNNGVLVVNENISYIDDSTFSMGGLGIRKVVINTNSPLEVGNSAFSDNDEIESIEINCPTEVILDENCFSECSNLKSVTINSKDDNFKTIKIKDKAFYNCTSLKNISFPKSTSIHIGKLSFCGCSELEKFDSNSRVAILKDFSFKDCSKMHDISFDKKIAVSDNSFTGCDSLGDIRIESIDSIVRNSSFFAPQNKYNRINIDQTIDISNITLSELVNYEFSPNYRFDNFIIDDLSDIGISNLKKVLSMYNDRNYFNHIFVGDFEVSRDIVENIRCISAPVILNNVLNISDDAKKVLLYVNSFSRYDDDFKKRLLNNFNSEIFNKNVQYFRDLIGDGFLNLGGRELFVTSPRLFEIDFKNVIDNINRLRSFCTINDNDIRICLFNDKDLSINLDDENSIRSYLADYITKNLKLPNAMNCLFVNANDSDIVEFADRLNYVTTMNLTGDEIDRFLCKDSKEIIGIVDDESFNRIYGDYKDRSSMYNEKISFLRGIKTKVYEKLKGYICQDSNENILFDRAFGPLIDNYTESYVKDAMMDYYEKISSYIGSDSPKKDLEYMKNIICGRILHGIIKHIKHNTGSISDENAVRNYLYNFKNDPNTKDIPSVLFRNLFDVTDSDTIETMLRIDPYSFDMFRNFSRLDDVPIREQLDSILENGNQNIDTEILSRIAKTRYLIDPNKKTNEIILGYDDVRYYRLAKSLGYRFTKEEDTYYNEKINDFNSQLDEVINDPKYSSLSSKIKSYRINRIKENTDIMKVFYEFLQNEITPANIPIEKHHDFEDKVRKLVNDFIESGSQDGTRLSKILYSVEMLYRNNNPAIVFKDRNEIIENPLLISNPNISDVKKIGIALVALNKMAHQQTCDFLPSEYSTQYRYLNKSSINELSKSSDDIVVLFSTLADYVDFQDAYWNLFRGNTDHGTLKNNKFYDYIDDGDVSSYGYEHALLLDIKEADAVKLFNEVAANFTIYKKLSSGFLTPAATKEMVETYKNNIDYIRYIIKYWDGSSTNPLLLSKPLKKRISAEFEKWKEHFDDEREDANTNKLNNTDYIKVFRMLKKIREAIKKDPDNVRNLFDKAVSQKNMYTLKSAFADILISELLKEINNSEESKDILDTICGLTKEEKIEMFKDQGIIVEVQEDVASPLQDVFVVYSDSIVEPYSIHLYSQKKINDKNREFIDNNRIISISRLDNKNLSSTDDGFSFDFNFIRLFTVDNKGNAIFSKPVGFSRANAILLDFININYSVMLSKYGITHDLISEILNGKVTITRDNMNNYIDSKIIESFRVQGVSKDELFNRINNIIEGTKKMVENLWKNNELKIPDDMILDPEFEYLKKYDFTRINNFDATKIRGLLGNTIIRYDDHCKDYYLDIVKRYNEILRDPNNPNYFGTLRSIFISLSTPIKDQLTSVLDENIYHFGDELISFKIRSNKTLRILDNMNIVVDMNDLKDDELYESIFKDFIERMSIRRAKRPSNNIEKLKIFDEIIKGIRTTGSYIYRQEIVNANGKVVTDEEGKPVYKEGKIEAYNLPEDFKQELLARLLEERKGIEDKIKNKNSEVNTKEDKKSDDLEKMINELDLTSGTTDKNKQM